MRKYCDVLQKTPESKMLGAKYDKVRWESMNSRVNPAFILRNYLMEEAIKLAEDKDDFSGVDELLAKAMNPFQDNVSDKKQDKRPDWRFDICISCSS